MITKLLSIPPILCYVIIAVGAICMFYADMHKDKYKVSGKFIVYGAVLADIIAGSISVLFDNAYFPVILFAVIEVVMLIAALIIEIRSANFQGAVYVIGRYIIGNTLGCLVVCLLASIEVLGFVAFLAFIILVGSSDSSSNYYDEENEFHTSYIYIDNSSYCINDVRKERFSGINTVELNDNGRSFTLEQDYEGSSTYHSSDGNTEYTRVGDSFIKH